ncbi:Lrp/AsnC family transcriptional regulator [Sciscionella sediminilitoris]|uniref:Lrp/AsnC family transcriptional regulator n=1 Tax=Sciscionella sediminilitoris TaxID=1445613 RepID=UPI0004DF1E10|nr:Lrp/AsnC family transcriptional regulator [Sciscionella sp. SE31]
MTGHQQVQRNLDEIDLTLISMLQTDGRASFTALAKAVELSEGAVRQRVQRLLREDAMQIVAVTDPKTVNLQRQAMIAIRVEGDAREVAARIAELEDAHYVVQTAGSFDILCELVCRDDEHLLAVLNTQIRTMPGVTSTETFMYLDLTKQTYAWGGQPSKR